MNYQEQVQNFSNKSSDKKKIIVIYGPTGSGKTNMSIEIAKMLKTEIISTDSRQIYKDMNIGTGKITPEEMKGVKHHMIDIIHPDEIFSVGDFKSQAIPIIEKLHSEEKIPMLVGGTGLYIDSLIFDFKLPQVLADPKIREELSKLTNKQQYEKLQEIDPEYAKLLHPNNRPYVERAIEVKILTGKSKMEFKEEKKLIYDVLFLSPEGPIMQDIEYREWLYQRINSRVEQMFAMCLEKEVRTLCEKGHKESDQGMKSIGYQEFFPYFSGEINIEEVLNQIQQHSRNYAKRQLTWFSKYEKFKL